MNEEDGQTGAFRLDPNLMPDLQQRPIITSELHNQLINQLKTQSPVANMAVNSPRIQGKMQDPMEDWERELQDYRTMPRRPDFAGILKHLDMDVDLGRSIAVDREIGEIIAMPRVVALALHSWLQWEVAVNGGRNSRGLSGKNLDQFIAMFAKKVSRRKTSATTTARREFEDLRDHCRSECDRLNFSKEMWPIVALHEEIERRGGFN